MPHPEQPARFLTRHRFVLLFVALLVFFLLVPIVHELGEVLDPVVPPILEAFGFLVVLGGAAVSVSTSPAWKLLTVGLALPTALLVVLHNFSDAVWITVLGPLFLGLFLAYAIAVILRSIFVSRQVTFNTVCASLCVYLLLGLMWALAYVVTYRLYPAGFRWSAPATAETLPLRFGQGQSSNVLYFSFATLTTLGYTDVSPASPLTRTLAIVEAITGQLYPAVLVARLVGLHIAGSVGQQPAPPAEGGRMKEEG